MIERAGIDTSSINSGAWDILTGGTPTTPEKDANKTDADEARAALKELNKAINDARKDWFAEFTATMKTQNDGIASIYNGVTAVTNARLAT